MQTMQAYPRMESHAGWSWNMTTHRPHAVKVRSSSGTSHAPRTSARIAMTTPIRTETLP